MKKLISLLGTVILTSSSVSSFNLTDKNYKIYNNQDTISNSSNLSGNLIEPQLLINLNKLTTISSPVSLTVANSSSVKYSEVEDSLKTPILNALKSLSILSSLLDVTFRVYKDASGGAYTNLDLSTASADVYVKVTAGLLSTIFVGASAYIKVSIPIAQDGRFALSNSLSITAPTTISAATPSSVIYSEIQGSINNNILQAIKAVAPRATQVDYSYIIYKDNLGTAFNNLNLSGRYGDIYVLVTATSDSNYLKGSTSYLKITLPPIKTTIGAITSISSSAISVSSQNQQSVTHDEVIAAISANIATSVQRIAPTAIKDTDYTFEIYSDASATSAYQNINLMGQTALIYLKIQAVGSSFFLLGQTVIQVILIGQLTNISNLITAIQPPMDVRAQNSASVTLSEVQAAIENNVLAAVQTVVANTTFVDFTYSIFSSNQGGQYSNVNLSNQTAIVWVKITAASDSLWISGATNYIKVILPALRANLGVVNSISSSALYVSAIDSTSVKENELRTALDSLVVASVSNIALGAKLNEDFTYSISNSPTGGVYNNLNLSDATASKSQTVYIRITANPTSLLLRGNTTHIGVALYGKKTNISTIANIASPLKVTAVNSESVTKSEVTLSIADEVLWAIQEIEPSVTSNDYIYNIYNWDGSEYTPLNLNGQYGYISIIITATENSTIIFGATTNIIVVLPPIA